MVSRRPLLQFLPSLSRRARSRAFPGCTPTPRAIAHPESLCAWLAGEHSELAALPPQRFVPPDFPSKLPPPLVPRSIPASPFPGLLPPSPLAFPAARSLPQAIAIPPAECSPAFARSFACAVLPVLLPALRFHPPVPCSSVAARFRLHPGQSSPHPAVHRAIPAPPGRAGKRFSPRSALVSSAPPLPAPRV